jgi:NAD/NADP transhydrogenase beta subunit
MAKLEKIRGGGKSRKEGPFPFGRENYLILLAGVVVIILGYLALSGDTVEGFMPLTLAPILLVIGYCVIIPIGIMYRKKDAKAGPADTTAG